MPQDRVPPLQWLWSILFVVQAYTMMAVLGLVFAPYAIVSKQGARVACKCWARWTMWTARWIVGITTEIRGTVPQGEVLIAAKHQSFLDVLMIFEALPQAKFIMKRELLWTPVFGLYARRLGCVPVDRRRRGAAIGQLVRDVSAEFTEPGQLIIYPQGTRVVPGAHESYKGGSSVLYRELSWECVPAATNVGLFWRRNQMLRRPGHAVVEFLDPIPPGQPMRAFLKELETRIETRSNALMAEAGFDADGHR
ncbi:MAG: 1-acyl-sn-glycerol-3-phosphate acyltransferase [Marinibacterium sp.]|nr:1-acyl-sn-glycerol-3-phosphate acyltransferase [Marinibacterium sp.]